MEPILARKAPILHLIHWSGLGATGAPRVDGIKVFSTLPKLKHCPETVVSRSLQSRHPGNRAGLLPHSGDGSDEVMVSDAMSRIGVMGVVFVPLKI